MKRFRLLIVLTIFIGMMGTKLFAHDIEVKNDDGKVIYYVWINNKTELAVSFRGSENDYRDDEYSGDIIIPESVLYEGQTYRVTDIRYKAFAGNTLLKSISIPNSVTSIGEGAFSGCRGLNSVTISNSVTTIGDNAFRDCISLASLNIPNSLKSIGIGAFYACYRLSSIVIPNSVISIGLAAFSFCYDLSSIKVEDGNTVYDSRENCNAIIETETNTLIQGCQSTIIPNSVTNIGNDAFMGCNNLTSITIPNSVTSINNFAFQQCIGLKSIVMSNSLTSIGQAAFCMCSSLSSVIIPNSVTHIDHEAFANCKNLTSITILGTEMGIGVLVFNGMQCLKFC